MQDLRNGFATTPPAPSGEVRRWPKSVDQLDSADQVLVRYRGENVVYDSPEALLDAMLAANRSFERRVARAAAAAVAADRLARRRKLLNWLFLAFAAGLAILVMAS